jgi:predicted DNA-binding ArsR family transcriptional regulator
MTAKKNRTFVEAKKIHDINERARQSSKQFKDIKKSITKLLEEGPKTIPQISETLNMPADKITYHLMTCRKYGGIEVMGIDDMDEYYLYGISKEIKHGED